MSPDEARQVASEDLKYLEEVERVADAARRAGVTGREWQLAVESVPVPRP
jgi:hypothetical protein